MTAKKRLIRISLISFLIFNFMSLFSCAVSGSLVVEATKLRVDDPDAATVTVMRGKSIVGAGRTVEIYVDNELTAYLGSGDLVKFNAQPGAHFVAVRQGDEAVARFLAEPNEKYYFFVGIGAIGIEQRTEKDAEDLILEDDYDNVSSND